MTLAADLVRGLMALVPYAGILLATAAAAFFSGSETGAYRVNRVRLRLANERGRRGAGALSELVRDMPGLICVTLIGTNTSVYTATALATGLWESAMGPSLWAELLATLSLAPVLLVFAEVLPKNIFNAEADRLMYAGAPVLRACGAAFRAIGLVAILKGISRLWTRLAQRRRADGRPAVDPFPAQARLRSIMRDSAAEGIVTPYQNELVEKIINLRNVHVGDAMVPAAQVRSVRQDVGSDELFRVIGDCRFNRLPVMDPTDRDVVGVLAVYDLLQGLAPGEEPDLARFSRPAVILSPAMTVTQAIFALQRNRAAMAIVRSPEGRYVGIVTLKDLVEEIVGELEAW